MTARATLFFEPQDVLQFRDHRPFDAGFNVTAQSVFPMPSVFHGCVRTALLRLSNADFRRGDFGIEGWARDLLGTATRPGSLALRGPLFARLVDGERVEPLLHLPRDVQSTRAGDQLLRPFVPAARRLHGRGGRLTEGPVPWTEEDYAKGSRPLLTLEGARHYLAAAPGAIELGAGRVVAEGEVCVVEERVGIVRTEATLTTEDGMFYSTRLFRLAPGAGFAVDVTLPGEQATKLIEELDGMVVPLGGKAHRARIRLFRGPLLPDDLAVDGPGPRGGKLWLLTPLPLKDDLVGWPEGVTCAATKRTVPIGGFDLAARAPKPLRRALPSGTVLWLGDRTPGDALAALGGPGWENDRRAGYGAALAAKGTGDR